MGRLTQFSKESTKATQGSDIYILNFVLLRGEFFFVPGGDFAALGVLRFFFNEIRIHQRRA
jgi:hypothetical protein